MTGRHPGPLGDDAARLAQHCSPVRVRSRRPTLRPHLSRHTTTSPAPTFRPEASTSRPRRRQASRTSGTPAGKDRQGDRCGHRRTRSARASQVAAMAAGRRRLMRAVRRGPRPTPWPFTRRVCRVHDQPSRSRVYPPTAHWSTRHRWRTGMRPRGRAPPTDDERGTPTTGRWSRAALAHTGTPRMIPIDTTGFWRQNDYVGVAQAHEHSRRGPSPVEPGDDERERARRRAAGPTTPGVQGPLRLGPRLGPRGFEPGRPSWAAP